MAKLYLLPLFILQIPYDAPFVGCTKGAVMYLITGHCKKLLRKMYLCPTNPTIMDSFRLPSEDLQTS